MAFQGKNELKHLLDAESGEWVAEIDPVLSMDDAYNYATSVATVLKTVTGGKTLFAYAFLVSNESTTKATYAILDGATVKIHNVILGEDVHLIPEGPNPRAPILKFDATHDVKIRSGGAPTIHVTMSYWEAELSQ